MTALSECKVAPNGQCFKDKHPEALVLFLRMLWAGSAVGSLWVWGPLTQTLLSWAAVLTAETNCHYLQLQWLITYHLVWWAMLIKIDYASASISFCLSLSLSLSSTSLSQSFILRLSISIHSLHCSHFLTISLLFYSLPLSLSIFLSLSLHLSIWWGWESEYDWYAAVLMCSAMCNSCRCRAPIITVGGLCHL